MEKKAVYAGGGSENSLLRISIKELLEANKGQIVKIRR
jgi:prolyl-tRNA editing enzyme YbaK/EbsC (Cys-tRNA(Pro) deacylase)